MVRKTKMQKRSPRPSVRLGRHNIGRDDAQDDTVTVQVAEADFLTPAEQQMIRLATIWGMKPQPVSDDHLRAVFHFAHAVQDGIYLYRLMLFGFVIPIAVKPDGQISTCIAPLVLPPKKFSKYQQAVKATQRDWCWVSWPFRKKSGTYRTDDVAGLMEEPEKATLALAAEAGRKYWDGSTGLNLGVVLQWAAELLNDKAALLGVYTGNFLPVVESGAVMFREVSDLAEADQDTYRAELAALAMANDAGQDI
jgi:hypothetical protein